MHSSEHELDQSVGPPPSFQSPPTGPPPSLPSPSSDDLTPLGFRQLQPLGPGDHVRITSGSYSRSAPVARVIATNGTTQVTVRSPSLPQDVRISLSSVERLRPEETPPVEPAQGIAIATDVVEPPPAAELPADDAQVPPTAKLPADDAHVQVDTGLAQLLRERLASQTALLQQQDAELAEAKTLNEDLRASLSAVQQQVHQSVVDHDASMAQALAVLSDSEPSEMDKQLERNAAMGLDIVELNEKSEHYHNRWQELQMVMETDDRQKELLQLLDTSRRATREAQEDASITQGKLFNAL